MNQLTLEDVTRIFDYDPSTGNLIYKVNRRGRGSIKAGDVAGVLQPNGYRLVMIKRKRYYVHRLIWFIHHNEWPDCIDHIDRDRDNNRLENLRNVTRKENAWNQSLNSDNTTGYTGVCWTAIGYLAHITHDGARYHLGYFDSPEDAAVAYNLKADELRPGYGRRNNINTPLGQLFGFNDE